MGLFDKFTSQSEEKNIFTETTRFGRLKIDEDNELFKAAGGIYHFEDLLSFELIEDKDVLTQGGVSIGRAIIGGALFGTSGSAVGAMSKVKKNDKQYCTIMQILFTVRNQKKAARVIPIIGIKTDKSKAIYKQSVIDAKSTIEGFNFIISQGNGKNNATLENFDDLKKLKELLDMGIISKKEFSTKKKELLNL